MAPNNHVFSIC